MADNSFQIRLDSIASADALRIMREFPKKMEEVNEVSLFRIGQDVRSEAGTIAPYKTGNLRRSLTSIADKNAIFEQRKNIIEVGSNLKYARAQEFGYGRIRAKKFLTKAIEGQKSGKASRIFSEEIKSVIK